MALYGLRRARKYVHATSVTGWKSTYVVNTLCTGRYLYSMPYLKGGVVDTKPGMESLLGLLLDTAEGAHCPKCVKRVRALIDEEPMVLTRPLVGTKVTP